mmetsp:Transcript_1442/g.3581  ORF Transcript_1442/g.3581 Transcript_1442/m.3581 type:complete len:214 (+) Transcript_1442:272-913(+)
MFACKDLIHEHVCVFHVWDLCLRASHLQMWHDLERQEVLAQGLWVGFSTLKERPTGAEPGVSPRQAEVGRCRPFLWSRRRSPHQKCGSFGGRCTNLPDRLVCIVQNPQNRLRRVCVQIVQHAQDLVLAVFLGFCFCCGGVLEESSVVVVRRSQQPVEKVERVESMFRWIELRTVLEVFGCHLSVVADDRFCVLSPQHTRRKVVGSKILESIES